MQVSYRESHKAKGADYHDTFASLPHRSMMWDLERAALRRIVTSMPAKPRHLDFACGTGRILNFLSSYVQSSTGVDISDSMLAVARKNTPTATFFSGDLTSERLLGDRQFDLITAFRFFPNAEPALRLDVMRALVRHLAPNGRLVFNNHMNRTSLQRRVLAMRGYQPDDGMTIGEVEELLGAVNLCALDKHLMGILPIGDNTMPGPKSLWKGLEITASTLVRSEQLSQNIIYVCGSR